jgi:DNA-directed RNA polymerase subunit RPC12/RpoP
MIPNQWPKKQNDIDIWKCKDCENNFGLLAEFGTPTFCPNCGSRELRKTEIPDGPNPRDRPRRDDIYHF